MGDRIRSYDWSTTPLGPIENWSQSLRTCVRIMLTSRQPIWIGWGRELIKLYNDPYKAIVGGKHPDALGKPASEVWREIWDDIDPMLRQVMDKDQGTYVEEQLLIMERNGYPEETYYTFSYTPVPGDNGETAGMICANTDDTEKIISERQLRTLTELGKLLTDSKSESEVFENTIGVLRNNSRDFPFAVLYKVQANKATRVGSTDPGIEMPEQFDLDGEAQLSTIAKNAIDQNNTILWEDLQASFSRLPTGAWLVPPSKALVLPVSQSGQNKTYGLLLVGLNPFRLAEEKYMRFFQLVATQVATSISNVHAYEEERKRAEALAEIDKAKTVFFTNISHEFRTPLTLMLGSLEELLIKQPAEINPENRNKIEVTHRNAMRLLRLVNNLLDFSRIEAGKAKAKFQLTDISKFTTDLASGFRSVIEHAGLKFNVQCHSIIQPVYLDRQMWEKIVLNLLSNAFKYTLQGTIQLSLSTEGTTVLLQIADTGVGIPEEELPKIFERFHRVQHSKGRTYEGTGIGLSLIHELVKLHNGTISVTSKKEEGTTFTVAIPIGNEHLAEEQIVDRENYSNDSLTDAFVEEAGTLLQEQDRDPALTDGAQSKVNLPKVLIIDDNADMRGYIKNLLKENYRVVTANNGMDGLQKVKSEKPDLVISDIMMPIIDGIEVVRELKGNPETSRLPVILLSARAGEESKIEGFDIGADDYLVKPFSSLELLARVRSQLNIASLRSSAEKYIHSVFQQAPVSITLLKGPDFVIEFANEISTKLVTKPYGEFINKPFFTAFPETQRVLEPLLRQVYTTGIPYHGLEVEVPLNNNGIPEKRYFNFIYHPFRDEENNVIGITTIGEEITEQVRARRKAEENEIQFREVLLRSPNIFLIMSGPEMRITFANEPLFRSWAKGPEIIGKPLLEVLPEIKDQPFPKLLEHVYTTGEVYYGKEEKAVLVKDGVPQDVYYTYVYQPVINLENAITGITVMASDITEQVMARKKIEESEKYFRLLSNTIPQFVWTCLPDGTTDYLSDQWETYTGQKPSEGMVNWKAVIHPDDLAVVEQTWKTAITNRQGWQHEYRIKNSKTGVYQWIKGVCEPLTEENGEVLKWIGSGTEIQSLKEQERYLEQLVAERTIELKKLNERLKESNEDLQQFAHVASHDLKEPLRKIQMFSDRMNTRYSGLLADDGMNYLGKIQNAARRMNAMIEGVLKYSSSNAIATEIDSIDLNEVIDDIQNDFEVLMEQKGARILHGPLPVIEATRVLIYQLFYNLINNSLKFSKAEVAPVITIRSESLSQKRVRITVQDNGIGFEPAYSEKIFETFARLNPKDKFEGTGLGLSLCRKIVQRHGGTITAMGKMGEGATFIIELPEKQRGFLNN